MAEEDCDSEPSISPQMACTIRPALGMSMSLSISAMPSSLKGVDACLDPVRKELMSARSKLEKLYREQGEQDASGQSRAFEAMKVPSDPTFQHRSQPHHPTDVAAPSDMLALLRSKMKKLLQEEEVAEQRRQAAVECILQSKGPLVEHKKESPERPHSRSGAARRSSLVAEDAAPLQKRPSTCPLKGSQGSLSRLCFPTHAALPGPRGDIEAADPFNVISSASEAEEPRLPDEVPYCTYSPLRLDSRGSLPQKKNSLGPSAAPNGFPAPRKGSLGLAAVPEVAPAKPIAKEETKAPDSQVLHATALDKAILSDEGITHDAAREQFIAMLKTRLAQKATKLPQRPLSKEEAEQLDLIQCRWAELTWASPEVLDRHVNTPGRGAIMGRRRSAATHSATLESVEAAEQWQRHEIQKEGARELGGLYRQLLEAL
eukprot:EG_transcript_9372